VARLSRLPGIPFSAHIALRKALSRDAYAVGYGNYLGLAHSMWFATNRTVFAGVFVFWGSRSEKEMKNGATVEFQRL
jgi:hypothetical protein